MIAARSTVLPPNAFGRASRLINVRISSSSTSETFIAAP
jgi:hypothetical protein